MDPKVAELARIVAVLAKLVADIAQHSKVHYATQTRAMELAAEAQLLAELNT